MVMWLELLKLLYFSEKALDKSTGVKVSRDKANRSSNISEFMLEYVKIILLKVSFDGILFEKELRKGLKMLRREELLQFEQWCYEKFADKYLFVLSRVFPEVHELAL